MLVFAEIRTPEKLDLELDLEYSYLISQITSHRRHSCRVWSKCKSGGRSNGQSISWKRIIIFIFWWAVYSTGSNFTIFIELQIFNGYILTTGFGNEHLWSRKKSFVSFTLISLIDDQVTKLGKISGYSVAFRGY